MIDLLDHAPGDFLLFSAQTYARLFVLQNAAWPAAAWLAPLLIAAALAAALWRGEARPALAAAGLAWAGAAAGFLPRYAQINWAVEPLVPLAWVQSAALLAAVAAPAAARLRRAPGAEGREAATPPAPTGTTTRMTGTAGRGEAARPRREGRAAARSAAGLILAAALLFPVLAPLQGRGWAGAEVAGLAPGPTALVTLGALALLRRRIMAAALALLPLGWLALESATLFTLGWTLQGALLALGAALGLGLIARRPA